MGRERLKLTEVRFLRLEAALEFCFFSGERDHARFSFRLGLAKRLASFCQLRFKLGVRLLAGGNGLLGGGELFFEGSGLFLEVELEGCDSLVGGVKRGGSLGQLLFQTRLRVAQQLDR